MTETNLVTPQLLADIDKVTQDCHRLHIPAPPVTFISLTVEDANGNVIHRHSEKANSWVRNAHNILASEYAMILPTGAYGATTLTVRDTGGSSYTSSNNKFSYCSGDLTDRLGVNASSMYGIVVGTGTNPENYEDYALQTLIATGTGAGQLVYTAGTLGTPSYNSGTKKWSQTASRIFNNNTASAISVSETGLYWAVVVGGSSFFTMIDRSLLSAAVAVPASYKLTVTYTTEYTFPA